ncbi:MAG: radical SAM protein [Sphingobacteriales bacterium]|nr:MAG: radical SAM protein [Sphingobacteriales bacterium]
MNEEAKLIDAPAAHHRLWMPKRVVFTAAAAEEEYGQVIFNRVKSLNIDTEILKNNRLTGLRGDSERETYKLAKNTLAVVVAPPSAFNLRPIPPSADFQFHLAEGCPAHCQYCYLAGSLPGPPAIRVFANLSKILDNTIRYEQSGKITSFEASCYTDPLSLEHITGGLATTITHFANRPGTHLRFVTKFDNITPLLNLEHNGRTRYRCSLNAEPVSSRLEGGTASIKQRITAMRRMAMPRGKGGGGYPVGIVLAPIMPIPDWQMHYDQLLQDLETQLDFECDLTFELITHRFTPGSKDVLLEWYPNTKLDMDETKRAVKTNKFGGKKFVFERDMMRHLKEFFFSEINRRFPNAKILYWT